MKLLSVMKLLITVHINTCKYVSNGQLVASQRIEMKSYCLKFRKNTENINPRVSNTNNGKTMVLSKCAICDSKKSRYIKNQEGKGLLSNLGIKTSLSKVPILGDILF